MARLATEPRSPTRPRRARPRRDTQTPSGRRQSARTRTVPTRRQVGAATLTTRRGPREDRQRERTRGEAGDRHALTNSVRGDPLRPARTFHRSASATLTPAPPAHPILAGRTRRSPPIVSWSRPGRGRDHGHHRPILIKMPKPRLLLRRRRLLQRRRPHRPPFAGRHATHPTPDGRLYDRHRPKADRLNPARRGLSAVSETATGRHLVPPAGRLSTIEDWPPFRHRGRFRSA